ncbi:MAG: hypothetical protein M3070_15415 [Actinomycetota bacterium]|nr:hypothetical protein [Actinomycetota bacterium]
MEVLPSAFRHGVDAEDIQHAITHALAVDQVSDDPIRYLLLGPTGPRTYSKSSCWTVRTARP